MSSRTSRLNIAFILFDFLLVAVAVFIIVFTQIWKGSKDVLKHLVINEKDLTAGLILAGFYIFSWLFSIPAFIASKQRSKLRANTTMLAAFNWTLVLAGLVTVTIGTAIWFFTLRLRVEFEDVWKEQSTSTLITLQNSLQCCGYWNATSAGLFTPDLATGFCANVQNVTASPCVTPITDSANFTLNNVFSSVYGFMAVVVALFLTSVCVINDRHEEVRFQLIDEKSGTVGGFV